MSKEETSARCRLHSPTSHEIYQHHRVKMKAILKLHQIFLHQAQRRHPAKHFVCLCLRAKQEGPEGDLSMSKNSYNNPAYYILEGVPNQSAAAVSPEPLPSLPSCNSKAPPQAARSKPSYGPSTHCLRRHQVGAINEEGSSEDDGGTPGGVGSTLNRPPPDFPPPPLPKGALVMVSEPTFPKARPAYPDLADIRIPAAGTGGGAPATPGESFRRGGAAALDDQSCSVLQMAKSLSESEFQGPPPRASSAPPPASRGQPVGLGLDTSCSFPPRHTITESIAEDLPEEVSRQDQPLVPAPVCHRYVRLSSIFVCVSPHRTTKIVTSSPTVSPLRKAPDRGELNWDEVLQEMSNQVKQKKKRHNGWKMINSTKVCVGGLLEGL